MNGLSINQALVATLLSAAVILAERAFPFLLFSKHEPPKIIRFIEKYIPPMVMSALFIYCLKDMDFTLPGGAGYVPYIAGIAVTLLTYIWKHNPLVSIFGGTGIYMILTRIL